MSDTSPKNQTALVFNAPPPASRQPKPGEVLFEFCRDSDHSRWRFELRDHGKEYGVEAQCFQNDEFFCGRRFDPRLDSSRTSRELAIAWAEEQRKHIEAYKPRTT